MLDQLETSLAVTHDHFYLLEERLVRCVILYKIELREFLRVATTEQEHLAVETMHHLRR